MMDRLTHLNAPKQAATVCCRNCGSGNLGWITDHIPLMVPEPYPLSGDMAVVVCRDCGFVGNTSSSANEDYIAYYTTHNKHYTRAGELRELDQAYFEGLLDLIDLNAPLDWSRTDVLDWGSGALLFSELATQRGARSASNFDMESGIPDHPLGLVVSTHCFEHVYDFNSDFSRIHDLLARNGLFLIAVPDLRGYAEVYYGPYAAFDLEHINHFEINTLTGSLVRAGFEVLATREAERRVTPTLAYPEILVLGRKAAGAVTVPALSSSRETPSVVLQTYLDRSKSDLESMLDAFEESMAEYGKRGLPVSPGVYGVASHAFRFLKSLYDRGDCRLDWIADSDPRLTGCTLSGLTIRDAEGLSAWVRTCTAQGTRPVAFIAAVNAHRIEAFLKDRFKDAVDICPLPPNCQNRES